MAFIAKPVTICPSLVLKSGTYSSSGLSAMTTPAKVGRGVTVSAFQDLRGLDQLARAWSSWNNLLSCGSFLQGLFDRDPQFSRDQFGDLVDIGIRHSHNALTSRIPCACMVPKVMICATFCAPYFLGHIINDLPCCSKQSRYRYPASPRGRDSGTVQKAIHI